ncbi:MAG: hypothetical protein LBK61_14365 [Spirochaetaceae bacterium]|jgi:hypothetical protein|nr:hypothetical protein [Spirochaetaceae bacterium]
MIVTKFNVKNTVFVLITALMVTAMLPACRTYGITYENGKAWPAGFAKRNADVRGTLRIGTIDVDKPGGSYSIEREINAILPLLFWEMGYVFEPATGNADYVVDVYARERDVQHGWKTKKSISLEVVLWPVQHVSYAGAVTGNDAGVQTPYAAGRTVIMGTAGLSISGNMESLLRKTAKKAVKAARRVRKSEAYE